MAAGEKAVPGRVAGPPPEAEAEAGRTIPVAAARPCPLPPLELLPISPPVVRRRPRAEATGGDGGTVAAAACPAEESWGGGGGGDAHNGAAGRMEAFEAAAVAASAGAIAAADAGGAMDDAWQVGGAVEELSGRAEPGADESGELQMLGESVGGGDPSAEEADGEARPCTSAAAVEDPQEQEQERPPSAMRWSPALCCAAAPPPVKEASDKSRSSVHGMTGGGWAALPAASAADGSARARQLLVPLPRSYFWASAAEKVSLKPLSRSGGSSRWPV